MESRDELWLILHIFVLLFYHLFDFFIYNNSDFQPWIFFSKDSKLILGIDRMNKINYGINLLINISTNKFICLEFSLYDK